MNISDVITGGFGSSGSPSSIITDGFSPGTAVALELTFSSAASSQGWTFDTSVFPIRFDAVTLLNFAYLEFSAPATSAVSIPSLGNLIRQGFEAKAKSSLTEAAPPSILTSIYSVDVPASSVTSGVTATLVWDFSFTVAATSREWVFGDPLPVYFTSPDLSVYTYLSGEVSVEVSSTTSGVSSVLITDYLSSSVSASSTGAEAVLSILRVLSSDSSCVSSTTSPTLRNIHYLNLEAASSSTTSEITSVIIYDLLAAGAIRAESVTDAISSLSILTSIRPRAPAYSSTTSINLYFWSDQDDADATWTPVAGVDSIWTNIEPENTLWEA